MILLLAAVAVLAFPYIGLDVRVPLPGWDFDAPVADLAALGLVAAVATRWRPSRAVPAPGPTGYALLLVAGVAALAVTPDAGASAHFLLRKPLFLYVAYGLAFAWAAGRAVPRETLHRLLLAAAAIAAIVSLATSLGRIAAGNALWWSAIAGLTNNHKTLAVALAPTVPLLLGHRRDRVTLAVCALVVAAVAVSVSRTAWIATALGLAFFVRWGGRPVAARRGLLAGMVAVGLLGAVYGPLFTRSHAQMDALRSRHSLDQRALGMFAAHPLVGAGGGASVRHEMHTFPHYRVNGVDAHGVVQKVGAEFGLLGLAGYALFVGAMARRLRARHRDGDGLWPAFLALHANLLLSTETFSQTHWLPLGMIWGLAHAPKGDA